MSSTGDPESRACVYTCAYAGIVCTKCCIYAMRLSDKKSGSNTIASYSISKRAAMMCLPATRRKIWKCGVWVVFD
jgi:hypothetical protein